MIHLRILVLTHRPGILTLPVETLQEPITNRGMVSVCICLLSRKRTFRHNDLVERFNSLFVIIFSLETGNRALIAFTVSFGEKKLNFSPANTWSLFL